MSWEHVSVVCCVSLVTGAPLAETAERLGRSPVWVPEVQRLAREYGYAAIYCEHPDAAIMAPTGRHVLVGRDAQGRDHAVVTENGVVAYEPGARSLVVDDEVAWLLLVPLIGGLPLSNA